MSAVLKPIETHDTRDIEKLNTMLKSGCFVHRHINLPERRSYHKIYQAGKDRYVLVAIEKESGQEVGYSRWEYTNLSNLIYQHRIGWSWHSWLYQESEEGQEVRNG
jgi:hypothetical protein